MSSWPKKTTKDTEEKTTERIMRAWTDCSQSEVERRSEDERKTLTHQPNGRLTAGVKHAVVQKYLTNDRWTKEPVRTCTVPFSLDAAHIQVSEALSWKHLYQRSVISDSDHTHQDCRKRKWWMCWCMQNIHWFLGVSVSVEQPPKRREEWHDSQRKYFKYIFNIRFSHIQRLCSSRADSAGNEWNMCPNRTQWAMCVLSVLKRKYTTPREIKHKVKQGKAALYVLYKYHNVQYKQRHQMTVCLTFSRVAMKSMAKVTRCSTIIDTSRTAMVARKWAKSLVSCV